MIPKETEAEVLRLFHAGVSEIPCKGQLQVYAGILPGK